MSEQPSIPQQPTVTELSKELVDGGELLEKSIKQSFEEHFNTVSRKLENLSWAFHIAWNT